MAILPGDYLPPAVTLPWITCTSLLFHIPKHIWYTVLLMLHSWNQQAAAGRGSCKRQQYVPLLVAARRPSPASFLLSQLLTQWYIFHPVLGLVFLWPFWVLNQLQVKQRNWPESTWLGREVRREIRNSHWGDWYCHYWHSTFSYLGFCGVRHWSCVVSHYEPLGEVLCTLLPLFSPMLSPAVVW